MKIKTKKGLWVSSSFTERFGSEEVTPSKTIPSFKTLEESMYANEIKNELGTQECTLEDVAVFLEKSLEGTKDGYANIFYVARYVVSARWSGIGRLWRVDAWELGVTRWDAGCRVFSSNWHSVALPSESPQILKTLDNEVSITEIEYLGVRWVRKDIRL